MAIPGVAGYRAARWARRNPGQAAAVAAGRPRGAGVGAGTAAAATTSGEVAAGTGASGPAAASDAYASRFRPDAPPAADGDGETTRRGAQRRGPGPEQEHARDRERRADGPAAGPAAQAGPAGTGGSGGSGPGGSGRQRRLQLVARRRALGGGWARPLAVPRHVRRCAAGQQEQQQHRDQRDQRGQRGRASARPEDPGLAAPAGGRLVRRRHRRRPPAAPRRGAQACLAAGRAVGRGRNTGQRKRCGGTSGHAVLAAPDTAGQITGGHHGTQPSPAQRRLRRSRHRARRARLLPGGPGRDPRARGRLAHPERPARRAAARRPAPPPPRR